MDPLAALWFASIVGAAGFTATGFFLARSRMVGGRPPLAEPEPAARPVHAPAEPVDLALAVEPAVPEATPAMPEAQPPARPTERPPAVPSTAPPPGATARYSSSAPRRDPRREEGDAASSEENETDVLRVDSVRPRRGASSGPPPVASGELERQLQALRNELRAEVVARDKIEMHARELAARLSSMSEQVTTLRARASEEAGAARRRSSIIPNAATDARTRLSARAPGLFAEIEELKSEIARLTAENESLRGSPR